MFYLAELFRQATFYLAELFRQATFYLVELFRQATFYLAELFRQIASSFKGIFFYTKNLSKPQSHWREVESYQPSLLPT